MSLSYNAVMMKWVKDLHYEMILINDEKKCYFEPATRDVACRPLVIIVIAAAAAATAAKRARSFEED